MIARKSEKEHRKSLLQLQGYLEKLKKAFLEPRRIALIACVLGRMWAKLNASDKKWPSHSYKTRAPRQFDEARSSRSSKEAGPRYCRKQIQGTVSLMQDRNLASVDV